MIYSLNLLIEEFDLDDYSEFVEKYPMNKEYETADTRAKVLDISNSLFIDVFGNVVDSKNTYRLCYDYCNEIWLVKGAFKQNTVSGYPFALIERYKGKILAVWNNATLD